MRTYPDAGIDVLCGDRLVSAVKHGVDLTLDNLRGAQHHVQLFVFTHKRQQSFGRRTVEECERRLIVLGPPDLRVRARQENALLHPRDSLVGVAHAG